jgi:galactonate dehydratase
VKPRWLFVKITDDANGVGWGEATFEGALSELRDRLIGAVADAIEHIWQLFWRLGFYSSGPIFMAAISGTDIALWDLKARRLNLPIHHLLDGAVRSKIQVYAWMAATGPPTSR